MTAKETAQFLASYNAWWRDSESDRPMPEPKAISEAIDNAVRLLTEQESDINELRAELEIRTRQRDRWQHERGEWLKRANSLEATVKRQQVLIDAYAEQALEDGHDTP